MIEIIAPPHSVTIDTAPFWDACDAGRLVLPRCGSCGNLFFPPRLMCPACGGRDVDWLESSGFGTVYAATRVHFAPFAVDIEVPFTLVIVELEQEVRILSRFVDDERPAPEIGDPVRVVFAAIVGTEQRLPVFVRTESP